MTSKATTPEAYLNELPADRKPAITAIRKAILDNLPKGFEETMQYGMLSYVVPHSIYPAGYHCKPADALPFISLASQKAHISFYHMALYEGSLLEWFQEEWPKYSSKKLDMGKSCVRFKKPEDVPVELLGKLCKKMKPKEWITLYEKHIKR
jgi:hypothetical protein